MWTPYDDWLNVKQVLQLFYMAAVVVISDGGGLRIEACCKNQPCNTKLSLYKPLLLKQLHISNKTEHFSCRGGYGVRGCYTCIKAFKTRADLGYR